jgi:hypothetical protein
MADTPATDAEDLATEAGRFGIVLLDGVDSAEDGAPVPLLQLPDRGGRGLLRVVGRRLLKLLELGLL